MKSNYVSILVVFILGCISQPNSINSIEKNKLNKLDSIFVSNYKNLGDSFEVFINGRGKYDVQKTLFVSNTILILDTLLHSNSILKNSIIDNIKVDSLKFINLSSSIFHMNLCYMLHRQYAQKTNNLDKVNNIFQPILNRTNDFKLNESKVVNVNSEDVLLFNNKVRLAILESALKLGFDQNILN